MDIIPHQLSEFDRLLAHGPYYEKLAMQGAVAGGLVSLFSGKPEARGNFGHALTYAIAGTGLAIGGSFILFQLGKFVSGRSHEAVAEAAAGAYAAGWHGPRRGFGRGPFSQQQFGQQFDQQDDDDQPPPPPPQQYPRPRGRGRW